MSNRYPKKTLDPIRANRRVDPPMRRAVAVAASQNPAQNAPLRWFFVLVAALVVAALGLAARTAIGRWTEEQAERQIARQMMALPEDQTAALVLGLVDLDQRAIPLVTLALVDPRPPVAEAAERALHELVSRWQLLPVEQSTPRVTMLAKFLAEAAGQVQARRRPFVRDLAAQLMIWPLDPKTTSAGDTIACCELILRLPALPDSEIRLAGAATTPPPTIAETPEPAPQPLPAELPTPLPSSEPAMPAIVTPQVIHPTRPDHLPDASREMPQEPKRFIAPRAIKIDG